MHGSRPPTRTHGARGGVIRSVLRCIEYLCWSAGTLAIAYLLLAWWSSAKFQASETKRLETLQHLPAQERVLHRGDPFGKISIPRIGLSAIVAEGIDERTLGHAVGHFPASSTPENLGTVALAGHRDTFFRGLSRVRVKDRITLETPQGKYQYEVVRTRVVGPEHIELVESSSESDLTLVTCFPFHYIGPAPKRFIVQAIRVRVQ
jgi:sortase A